MESKCKSQTYLREQLVDSLLNQWAQVIHGGTGGADQALPAVHTLQIHNPVLNVRRVNAQEDAEGDGRHRA